MTILDQIVANKKKEILSAKKSISVGDLTSETFFSRPKNSLVSKLRSKNSKGIIAEYKRKSPSKGIINDQVDIIKTTQGYSQYGAAGISILTDLNFFGGQKEDLINARIANQNTPLLRKDFMIDPYQVYEAKAWGADVILLIAAQLKPEELYALGKLAHELDLEVLLEVHDALELQASPMDYVDIVGVNNRNLKNFSENNVDASISLSGLIPKNKIKISESCISEPETVKKLIQYGYEGFLMGESFMKTNNPPLALDKFISGL